MMSCAAKGLPCFGTLCAEDNKSFSDEGAQRPSRSSTWTKSSYIEEPWLVMRSLAHRRPLFLFRCSIKNIPRYPCVCSASWKGWYILKMESTYIEEPWLLMRSLAHGRSIKNIPRYPCRCSASWKEWCLRNVRPVVAIVLAIPAITNVVNFALTEASIRVNVFSGRNTWHSLLHHSFVF